MDEQKGFKMMQLKVNYLKGVNNIFFGMPPYVVSNLLGEAESTALIAGADEKTPASRSEIRNGVKFSYEDEKLVCISGDLGVPFYLGKSRIPRTFLQAYKVLNNKSKLTYQFPNDISYVFADLGIVVYPSTVTDLDVGIQTTTTKHKIAVCKREIMARFTKHFLNREEESENLNSFLLGMLGNFTDPRPDPDSVYKQIGYKAKS